MKTSDGIFGKYYGLPRIFYAPILGMLVNKAYCPQRCCNNDCVYPFVCEHICPLEMSPPTSHTCNLKPQQIWHDMAWPLVAFVETILIPSYLLPSTITSSKIKIVQDTTSHTCIHPHWTCFRQKSFKFSHWHICDQKYYCPYRH